MDHRQKLEELHQQALDKFQEYEKLKDKLDKDQHQQLQDAKGEWQTAWNKLRDVLMVLERLEI